jgi:hypothetical protein
MSLIRALSGESVLLLALVSAVCIAVDLPEVWVGVVLAAVPLVLALLVRQVVASPATVVKAVTDAATGAVKQVTQETAGAVGEVTEGASGVVTGVVEDVVGQVGGLVPALGLGRK